MTTSKVNSILNTREWSWPNGAVFYIQMKLENWETITLGKKSKDAFKVWDSINYEVVEPGKKWKEVKENNYARSNAQCSQYNSKSAQVGMAIKVAFDLVYEKKWLDEAKKLTKEILLFAQELLWEDTNLPS